MAKKQYLYQARRVAAVPRNKRLADAIQEVATGGGWNGSMQGGFATIKAEFDILPGDGVEVEKSADDRLTYTISHSDTSFLGDTTNQEVSFIQNLSFDDFGHVTEVESARITNVLDGRYLRKDVDDTAHGHILFDQRIGSTVFLDGMQGKGWGIEPGGSALVDSARIRNHAIVGGPIGSETFVSGFPNGIGWDLGPYKRFNAADVEETKHRLELDDLIVRGKLRVFEMIISQLRGENDNVIFAGQMKVAFYDAASGRLYLDTDQGILYNPFRSGDMLMVQRFGGLPSAGNHYNVIKQYELRVDEAGIGSLSDGENRLDWITFTNFVGELSDIAVGDVLTRVDSVADSTRKGIVKITTVDETGAPYLDVAYGLKTDPEHATKVRLGNLSGIRTRNQADLTGVWGLYAEGAVLENSTFYLANGMTVEQQFTVMNGELDSKIEGVKNDMSLEPGNLLRNSSFSSNTNYWRASGEVHFVNVGGSFLWLDDAFYVEKKAVADIYQDAGKRVLRILNTRILQSNDAMSGEKPAGTYSFSLYAKVLRAGTLTVGFSGQELCLQEALSVSESYRKLTKAAAWDGTGDFSIAFTGEILIYGVSLFNDALADATVRLQTQIQQNAERISLAATKEYVDRETGHIYQKYDSELKVQADQIAQRVTKTEYETGTNAIKQEWESKLSVEAGRISAISTKVDNLDHTISTSGWLSTPEANTLYASKTLENGNKIISYINQTATTATISASRINLYGAVSFQMFDPSLQGDFRNKLTSTDVGSLAFKDKVSNDDLALSLAEDLASRINLATFNNTLNDYTKKGTITRADLQQALRDEINGKLTGSVTTGADKLAKVVINGQTLIAGGYIQADLINVDELFARKATIGGFKICSEWLESTNGSMRLAPSGLVFDASPYYGAFGANAIPGSAGSGGCVYLRNIANSSDHTPNGACIFMDVGKSIHTSYPQTWIACRHYQEASAYSPYGWGSRFIVQSRYFGDDNGMERTVIEVGQMMTSRQLELMKSGSHQYLSVYYDAATGYLCAKV